MSQIMDAGLPKKISHLFFDRFYCADKSRTDKSHFGLGLSIAKELTRMLAGKIGFEDTSGGGATFFFDFAYKVVSKHEESLSMPDGIARMQYAVSI